MFMEQNKGNSLLSQIDLENLPRHIAIIMDGNGRWASKRLLPRNFGHREGMKRVVEIVEAATQLGIDSLTLYAFSTENWKRPEKEIDGLMNLLVIYIRNELNRLIKNNVKLNILGDISPLPNIAKDEVKRALEETKDNTGMNLNIALNYGGRHEILNSIKLILKDIEVGNISIDDLDEEIFSQYLYTRDQADPDLLIRPSGELRISNFLLYQIAYTEFWFSNVLWPDFTKEKLYEAIIDFQKRNRRFGGI
ncbi:MAG: isoprenyl transferase [Tissierellaceae bacterium]|nr:isoprenyl transferase [Tissierellia bacterium]